ncbi:MAG: ECF-type sigma factor [Planctomycetota bacterium]|nr:ECF-type sigma factor [Planctomycetota bacterium]
MVKSDHSNRFNEDVDGVYSELRQIARRYLAHERNDHTLQPTALVHEAFLRMQKSRKEQPRDPQIIKIRAAHTMRLILVDHARRRNAQKRNGGGRRLQLEQALNEYETRGTDLVELNEALEKLNAMDEQLARIVELRFFGRMTAEETAEVMEVSVSTIVRGWRFAKLWLYRQLTEGQGE